MITIAQAKVEFEKITGQDPDHLLTTGTDDALLGEYCDSLRAILAKAPKEEVETPAQTESTAAEQNQEETPVEPLHQTVTLPTEKMVTKRLTKPKGEPKVKKEKAK